MKLIVGLQILDVLIMWYLNLLIFPCKNSLLQVLRQWLLGMAKSCLLLILAMESCVLHLITLSLMVYLGFLILLQNFYLSISFVYKIMHSTILMLIDSLSTSYFQGRSFTKDWVKMVSILFQHHFLCHQTHPLLLLTLLLKFINLHLLLPYLLLILLKSRFGTKGLDIQLQNFFTLLYNL